MNLIFHIVQKDLKRLKWFFAGWAVWILAPVGFAAVNLALADGEIHLRSTLLNMVFYDTWFSTFLVYVLTALVIQQDPLVGTSAFWVTRPISSKQLLAAKAFLIGTAFVVVPLVMDALTLSLENVTLHDILLSLPNQFMTHAVIAVIAVVPAVLTPNFGTFAPVMALVWYFNGWVSFPLYVIKQYNFSFIPLYENFSKVGAQQIVVCTAAIILGFFLACFQFKTRNTQKAAVLAVLIYLTLGWPQFFWKWDFTANHEEPVSRQVLDTDKVEVSIAPHAVWLATGDWAYPRPLADYSADVSISGAGVGQEIRLVDMSAQMTFNYGQVAKDSGWDFFPKLRMCDTPDGQALKSALGALDIQLLNPRNGRPTAIPIMRLDQKTYKRYEKETALYQADMLFSVFSYKPEAEIGLRPEAGFRSGSQSVTVVEITPQTHGVNVEIQEEVVHLPFNHDPNINKVWTYEEDNVTYVLWNKKLKQAFLPDPLDTQLLTDGFQVYQPLRVRRSILRFSGNDGFHNDIPTFTQAWMKDAVLMRIRLEPQGTFSKTITRRNFTVAGNGGVYSSPEKWGLYNIFMTPCRYSGER